MKWAFLIPPNLVDETFIGSDKSATVLNRQSQVEAIVRDARINPLTNCNKGLWGFAHFPPLVLFAQCGGAASMVRLASNKAFTCLWMSNSRFRHSWWKLCLIGLGTFFAGVCAAVAELCRPSGFGPFVDFPDAGTAPRAVRIAGFELYGGEEPADEGPAALPTGLLGEGFYAGQLNLSLPHGCGSSSYYRGIGARGCGSLRKDEPRVDLRSAQLGKSLSLRPARYADARGTRERARANRFDKQLPRKAERDSLLGIDSVEFPGPRDRRRRCPDPRDFPSGKVPRIGLQYLR